MRWVGPAVPSPPVSSRSTEGCGKQDIEAVDRAGLGALPSATPRIVSGILPIVRAPGAVFVIAGVRAAPGSVCMVTCHGHRRRSMNVRQKCEGSDRKCNPSGRGSHLRPEFYHPHALTGSGWSASGVPQKSSLGGTGENQGTLMRRWFGTRRCGGSVRRRRCGQQRAVGRGRRSGGGSKGRDRDGRVSRSHRVRL